jgi:hypothetical protein
LPALSCVSATARFFLISSGASTVAFAAPVRALVAGTLLALGGAFAA